MKPRLTKLRCGICDRRLREGEYVYSRWTGERYCCDLNACKRKRKRKGGREAPSPT
jgi:hypothetical protein